MDNQITTQPTVDGKKVSIVTIPWSAPNDTVYLVPEKYMPLNRFFDKGKPFQKIALDDDDRILLSILSTLALLIFSIIIDITFDSFLIGISFFILVPVILVNTYKKVKVKLSRSVKTVVLRNAKIDTGRLWSHPRDEKIIDFRFRTRIPVSMIEDALRFNDPDVFSLIESFSSISDIDTVIECYNAIENYAEIVRKHDKVVSNDNDRSSQEWITVAAEKARIIADSYDDVFKGAK